MSNKFYYSTSVKLTPGSIIEKGLSPLDLDKGVPFAYNNYNYIFIEMVLELVRLEKFNNKPKRSDSVFVCETKDALNEFMKSHRENMLLYYYEVEPVKTNYNFHIGDFTYHNLTFKLKEDFQLKKMKFKDFYHHAELYWTKNPSPSYKEVVLSSPIKIIKEFDF